MFGSQVIPETLTLATLLPVEIWQTVLGQGEEAFWKSDLIKEQMCFKLHVGIVYVPRRRFPIALSIYTTLGN